jgi:hypothetical protein
LEIFTQLRAQAERIENRLAEAFFRGRFCMLAEWFSAVLEGSGCFARVTMRAIQAWCGVI